MAGEIAQRDVVASRDKVTGRNTNSGIAAMVDHAIKGDRADGRIGPASDVILESIRPDGCIAHGKITTARVVKKRVRANGRVVDAYGVMRQRASANSRILDSVGIGIAAERLITNCRVERPLVVIIERLIAIGRVTT